MRKLYNLDPDTEAVLSELVEPLAGYIGATTFPPATLVAALAILFDSLREIAAKERLSLTKLLMRTSDDIREKANSREAAQFELDLTEPAERRQREADRRYWQKKLALIEQQLESDPERVAGDVLA